MLLDQRVVRHEIGRCILMANAGVT
jgi:hypothetical protein